MKTRRPTLLCIAGFDPTGGAGLQADIETAAALGVRIVCAQTCNTVQRSAGAEAVMPTPPTVLARQVEYLIADFDIAAVKIGLIATAENAESVAEVLAATDLTRPLVIDPVLRDGTGEPLCDDDTARAIRHWLLPLTTCVTPNRAELEALVPDATTSADAARALLGEGCRAVFVTDEGKQERVLHHSLYESPDKRKPFHTPHLPGEFHGSGCTLSCALAAQLALGASLPDAAARALAFTSHAIANADPNGGNEEHTGRRFPRRL